MPDPDIPSVADRFVIDGQSVKVDGLELPFVIGRDIEAVRYTGVDGEPWYLVHIEVFADHFEAVNLPTEHGVRIVDGDRPRDTSAGEADIYQRTDGRWAFRIIAGNGEIVATDGGQGYENKADAERTGRRLANGWEADMQKNTTTLYGVARKDTVLDDQLYPSFADARAKLARTEDAMRTAGLEPDVRLVQVEAVTEYSRPKNAIEPEVDVPPTTVPTDGAGEVPNPTTGVWGDSGVPIADDPNGESVPATEPAPAADTEPTPQV